MIIPVFIPHGGCPERCSFCNQAVSGGSPTPLAQMRETVRSHLATKRTDDEAVIAFYGGTFTALSERLQLGYLECAAEFFDKGVSAIRLATRPDAIEASWIHTLKSRYRLKTVELGVQSFNPEVLKALGRSHTSEHLKQALTILRAERIEVGFHLMFGCPGEGDWGDELPLFKLGLRRLRPDFVRIHPLLVLEGTALSQTPDFVPLGLEKAVTRAADLMDFLEGEGIPCIRLGLQPNEIMNDSGVLSGPYHPAFGELVKSERFRRIIETQLNTFISQGKTPRLLEIDLSVEDESAVKGHGKQNLLWLKNHFPLLDVRVSVVRKSSSRRINRDFLRNHGSLHEHLQEHLQIRIHDSNRPS